MSYPGGFLPGNGYGHGYGPPDPYHSNGQQPQYASNLQPQTTWDGSYQGMSSQQIEQMGQMQQARGQLQTNQAAYYQQQYAPVSPMPASSAYSQMPLHAQHPYSHYPNQHQQQFPLYKQPSAQSHHITNQQPALMGSSDSRPSVSQPVYPPKPASNARIPISRNGDQIETQSKNKPKSEPKHRPLDNSILLMALAEEYIAAAHSLSPSVAQLMNVEEVHEYQSLIATALGCLEACFRKLKLPPRLEARVRLRYASVLFEETENYMEAETALSQGIILCEQNRYFDLKYSMQFLLARLVFMKNPKAAMKSLERLCADAKAYVHRPWEYVFRFLRASLSLKSTKIADAQTALHDLRYVSSVALENRDHAIFSLSSLMEVLVHLSFPNPESPEQLQQALAAAWTYQLDADSRMPQLLILTHILDVTCSLLNGMPTQTEDKQKAMEEAYKSSKWSTSTDTTDAFALPINPTDGGARLVSQDTRELLTRSEDGRHLLLVSFLNSNDTFALVYLLSGIALLPNNCINGKSAQYLRQGLRSLSDSIKSRKQAGPVNDLMAKLHWRQVLSCYTIIYSVFCFASSCDWPSAKDRLMILDENLKELDNGSKGLLAHLQVYLLGICSQGTGNLKEAMARFGDPKLRLSERDGSSHGPEEQLQHDLSLLATLNTLWIQQGDPNHDPVQNTAMIARLEPLCAKHPNRELETAFMLVKATLITDPPASGVKIKNYLGAALEAAKATSNKQFLSITLSVMCSKFFVGVVGDQADKAGKAAVFQAKRARNNLWMSVSNGMLAQNLELQGKHGEAADANAEARRLAALALPNHY